MMHLSPVDMFGFSDMHPFIVRKQAHDGSFPTACSFNQSDSFSSNRPTENEEAVKVIAATF